MSKTTGNLATAIGAEREAIKPGTLLVPNGEYKAMIVKSSVEPNSKGTGLVLKIEEEIQEPKEFKGKKLKASFNIKHNESEEAQRIGRGECAECAVACGLPGIPAASEELHGRPHMISVKTKAGSGINPKNNQPYGDSNEITRYYKAGVGEVKATPPANGATEETTIDEDRLPF